MIYLIQTSLQPLDHIPSKFGRLHANHQSKFHKDSEDIELY